MSRRAWMLPVVLLLALAACGDWLSTVTPTEQRQKRKQRRQLRLKEAREAKKAAQRSEHANTSYKRGPDDVVERKGDVPPDAPNILLVSIDTLRADALKPYGSTLDNAHSLAALAKEGVVFQRSWSQAPSTSPTHASMFTSALPSEHGLMGTKGRLPMSWYTLAEHMQAYGVRTWASTSSVRFAMGVQLHQGFDEYSVYSSGSQHGKTTKALKVALDAIQGEPERPWFGFVHLMDVHAPYSVPEPHQSKFLEGPPSVKPERTVNFLHRFRLRPQKVSDEQLRDLKAMYAGGVSHVDTRIQELWDAVRKLERPTIIVVTADHGEAFFENNFMGHGTFVHETVMRVPLIFWAPGIVPEGQHRSTLSQSIDLFPTLSTMMGLPVPDGLRGADLSPVVLGKGEQLGRTVICQSPSRRAIVRDTDTGTYKVVLNPKARGPRMYDLGADPLEQQSIVRKHRELATAWAEELRAMDFTEQTLQAETWEMSDEEREALEAIGYMDAGE